jgi:alkyl sulfatase BDS1-like metallo-beta-lactamase superfamily hydrolase
MSIRSVPTWWVICLGVSMSLLAGGASQTSAAGPEHFDPLGKPPSEHTLKAIAQDSAGLPFDDTRDFDEAAKGFIAEPDSWKVLGPEGNVVWDLARYDFFRTDTDFPSVHPSLQRVSRLNMKVGLFEVKPDVYVTGEASHDAFRIGPPGRFPL